MPDRPEASFVPAAPRATGAEVDTRRAIRAEVRADPTYAAHIAAVQAATTREEVHAARTLAVAREQEIWASHGLEP